MSRYFCKTFEGYRVMNKNLCAECLTSNEKIVSVKKTVHEIIDIKTFYETHNPNSGSKAKFCTKCRVSNLCVQNCEECKIKIDKSVCFKCKKSLVKVEIRFEDKCKQCNAHETCVDWLIKNKVFEIENCIKKAGTFIEKNNETEHLISDDNSSLSGFKYINWEEDHSNDVDDNTIIGN